MKAVTWNKDSHGLFDYENNQYEMKKFQISHAVKIYRISKAYSRLFVKLKIMILFPQRKKKSQFTRIIKLNFCCASAKMLLPEVGIFESLKKIDKFYINVAGINNDIPLPNQNHNIYLIVRSLKAVDGKNQRGYALNPGDVIKLGRIEYRVIESQVGTNNLTVKKVSETNKVSLSLANPIFQKAFFLIFRKFKKTKLG